MERHDIADGGLQVVPQIAAVQYVYLDFDGELTSYNGEILTVEDVVVEHSGLSEERIENILAELNGKYAAENIVFVTEIPAEAEYSTIYVGKSESFKPYGSFAGLAETLDENNEIKTDKAFVMLNSSASNEEIIAVISHETDHLIGTLTHGGEGINAYAATYVISSGVTSTGMVISANNSAVVTDGGVLNSATVSLDIDGRYEAGVLHISSGGVVNSVYVDGGSMHISNGGVANDVATYQNGVVTVSSGGVIFNAQAEYGDIYVEEGGSASGVSVDWLGMLFVNGGVANDTVVNSSGSLDIGSGVANSTTVNSEGCMYISSGGTHRGSLTIADGAEIEVEEGGIIDFTVAGRTSEDDYLINNLAAIEGTPTYTITVNTYQAAGTYKLAQGANAFEGTITIGDGTTDFGSITVNGDVFEFYYKAYTLTQSNGDLLLTVENKVMIISKGIAVVSGEVMDNAIIISDGRVHISSGGVANETTVNSDGRVHISSGGVANETTVNSDGWMDVSSGGVANETTVNSDGYLNVFSGGAANETTINSGGLMDIRKGGVANETTVNSEGSMHIRSGGVANSTTVNSGGYVHISSGGVANSTTVNSDGSVYVFSVGVANSTTIYEGFLYVFSGGAANETTINSGDMRVANGGVANKTTVNSGGWMDVCSGGVANSTTVNSVGSLYVSSVGVANKTTVNSGGWMDVCSGGVANETTVNSGSMYIYEGGEANETTVISGGSMTISGGGTHRGTLYMADGANVLVEEGAVIDFTVAGRTVEDDYLINNLAAIEGTPTYTITVDYYQAEGTYKLAQGADAFTGTVSIGTETAEFGSITVNGDDFAYSNKTFSLDLVDGDLTLTVTASPAVFIYNSNGGLVSSGAVLEKVSVPYRGSAVVTDGGVLISATVDFDWDDLEPGVLHISSGGVACNTIVSGSMYISNGGVASDTLVASDGMLSVSSGGAAYNTSAYGFMDVESGAAADGIIIDGGSVVVAGAASNVEVNGEGHLRVVYGNAEYITVYDGSVEVLDGTASNIVVQSGGGIRIYRADVTDLTLSAGGMLGGFAFTEDKYFAEIINATAMIEENVYIVSNTMHVSSGGVVNRTTVDKWGTMYISNGGVANSTTVNSYGSMYISSGASATDIVVANGAVIGFDVAENTYIQGSYNGSAFEMKDAYISGYTVTSSGYMNVVSGGTASDIVVNANANMTISSGGTAVNIWENGGWVSVAEGANVIFASNTISSATVSGSMTVHSNTVVNNLHFNRYGYNGNVTVYDGGIVDYAQMYHSSATLNISGGTVNSAYVGMGTVNVMNGGVLNSAQVSADVDGDGEGKVIVSSGGTASSASVLEGTMDVFGGVAYDTYAAGYLTVADGGVVYNTTVVAGDLTVANGGVADSTTVNSYGYLWVSSGGVHRGSLSIAKGAVVSAYAGGIVDFTVAGRTSEDDYLINDLALIKGAPTYTITVDADQAEGTYKLAQGASAFTGTISIGTETADFGSITVNGDAFKYGNATYTLTQTNGDLLLDIVTEPAVFIYSSGALVSSALTLATAIISGSEASIYVSSGGLVSNAFISSGATMHISSGGAAGDVSVHTGANVYVTIGGTADNVSMYDGGILHVSSGGAAGNVLIHESANAYVSSGGSADDVSVFDGGVLHVSSGGAIGSAYISEGEMYVYGGVVNDVELLEGDAYITDSGVISATRITGGILHVSSGGVANNNAISNKGEIHVAEGGLAVSNTIAVSGYLNVSSGGSALNTQISTYSVISVLDGGVAESTMVTTYGTINIADGGVASNTSISNRASVSIASGGMHKGSLSLNSSATVSVEEGAVIDFTVAGRTVEDGYLINNLSLLGSAPTYTITVDADQAEGTYKLAQGASAFEGTITIGDGTTDFGSITVNGDAFKYNDKTYTLTQTNGDLLLDIAEQSSIIISGITYVSSGMTMENATIVSGGKMHISSGGVANETTVNSSGYLDIFSGGEANETTVNSSGYLYIFSGGVANSTTVNSGGLLLVYSGGTAANIIASNGARLGITVASDTYIQGSYNGSAFEMKDAYISGFTFNSGGMAYVYSGGEANETTVNFGGELHVSSGGEANSTTVNSGGLLMVYSGGTAANIIASNGAQLGITVASDTYIQGSYNGSAFEMKDAYISGYTLNSNCHLDVYSGGVADETTVNSGNRMWVTGVANKTTINSGLVDVSSGGVVSDTTVNSGYMYIFSGGVASETTVNSGGIVRISSSGTATATKVNSGSITVFSGGEHRGSLYIAEGAVVSAYEGGVIDFTVAGRTVEDDYLINNLAAIEGTPTYTITVDTYQAAGTYKLAQGADAFTGSISIGTETADFGSITVNGDVFEYGHAAYTLTQSNGDLLLTIDNKTAEDTVFIYSNGELVSAGTVIDNAVIVSGGNDVMHISSGGEANYTTVNTSGSMYIYEGGVASETVVNSSGYMYVYEGGVANYTTVNSGGRVHVSSGGVANATTVNSGILEVSSGGAANETTVNSRGHMSVLRGGAASDTVVNSGGYLGVYYGGTATNIIASDGARLHMLVASNTYMQGSYNGSAFEMKDGYISGYTVNSGCSMAIVSGGTATNIIASDGARLYMRVVSDTYIQGSYNGSAFEMKDAYISGYTVNFWGEMDIFSGGVASDTVVNSGALNVVRGGVASETTVNSRGSMYVSSGGTHRGTLYMADGANVLVEEGAVIDFTVAGRTVEDDYLINDLSLITGAPTYTITVDTYQASGTYKLAQGADDFTGTITIGDGTTDFGSITVNGEALVSHSNNTAYTLTQTNGDLLLNVDFYAVAVYSSGALVASGSTIDNAVLAAGGNNSMSIVSGGVANSTTVTSSGSMTVSRGGLASNTELNTGGYMKVYGGVANRTTVNSRGHMVITSGGVASRATVNSGGYLFVENDGTANNVVVNASGSMTVSKGAASNTTVAAGGYLYVKAYGTVDYVTIEAFGSMYLLEGTANNVTVHSGGSMQIASTGDVNGLTLSAGGWLGGFAFTDDKYFSEIISGSAVVAENVSIIDSKMYVSGGGVASNTIIAGNGIMYISSGGMHRGTLFIDSNAKVNVASGGTIDFTVAGRTVADDYLINDLSLINMSSNAIFTITLDADQASGTYKLAQGAESFSHSITIGDGTIEYGTISLSSGVLEYNDAKYSLSNVDGNLQLIIDRNEPVRVYSSSYLIEVGAAVSGTELAGGMSMHISSGGMASNTMVNSGGLMEVSGGAASNTTVYGGSMNVISGAAHGVIISGGSMTVAKSATVSDIEVNFGGRVLANSGGIVSGVTINSSGMVSAYKGGVVNDVAVNSGGIIYIANGTVNDITVNSRGRLVMHRGSASGVIVSSGALLNITVSSGNYLQGSYNGSAFEMKDGVISNFTVGSASLLNVSSGGIAINTVMESRGQIRVFSGGAIRGELNAAYGTNVSVESGGIVDFTVAGRTEEDGYLISKLSVISGSAAYTITVDAEQESGTYKLAQEAWSLHDTYSAITIGDGTTNFGQITVNGATLKYNDSLYMLKLDEKDNLTLTVINDAYVMIYSNGELTSAGKVVDNALLSTDGDNLMQILSGGTANSTTIKGFGSMHISSGGTANDTTILGDGIMYISQGGTASGIVADSGAKLVITAADDTYMQGSYNGSAFEMVDGRIADFTVNSSIKMYIAEGGKADNMAVDHGGYMQISGGAVNNTVVNAHGVMDIVSGTAADTVVNDRGRLYISGGAVHRGSLEIAAGAVVSAYEGSIIDFTIANRTAADGCLINDLALISGAPTYTITVTDNQTSGVYTLAQGASDFVGTISIGNGTLDYGTITVNGAVLEYNNVKYTLTQSNGDLLLGVENNNDPTAVFIYDRSGTLLSSGVVIENAVISNPSGTVHISSGGVLNGMSAGSVSTYVSSGGIANEITKAGGTIYIYEGGVVSGVENQGGQIMVSGGVVNAANIYRGQMNVSSGLADGAMVVSSGRLTISNGASAANTVVSSGGSMTATGVASNTVVTSGGYLYIKGQHRGSLTIEEGSIVSATGSKAIDFTLMDRTAEDGYLINDMSLITGSYGCTITVSADQALGTYKLAQGAENFTGSITVNFDGFNDYITVYVNDAGYEYNGVTYTLTNTDGNLMLDIFKPVVTYDQDGSVCSGAIVNNVVTYDMIISSGGVANNTLLSGGYLSIYSGGVANNTLLTSGGSLSISSGGVANNTLLTSGGSLRISSGGVANDTVINSRCSMAILSGGVANGVTLDSGNLVISSGGVANEVAMLSGCVLRVSGGATINGITLNSYGSVTITSGGVVNSAAFGGERAYLHVNGGVANYASVESMGYIYVRADGSVNFADVGVSGRMVVQSGGSASNITVSRGNLGINGMSALAEYITVFDSGTVSVQNGGIARFSDLTGKAARMFVHGGIASDTVVNSGGMLRVGNGTATGNTINASGNMYVSSNGMASDTLINAGGKVFISSGAVVSDTVVASDGTLTVSSGGVHRGGLTINEGAVVSALAKSIIDFDLTGMSGNEEFFINDISRIIGAPDYTVTVTADQAFGTYKLAQGAENFTGSITVTDGMTEYGTISVENAIITTQDNRYVLEQSNGDLSISVFSNHPVLVHSGSVITAYGETFDGETVAGDHSMRIFDGGAVNDTTVNGAMYIYQSGAADNTILSGNMYIQNGGIAGNTTVAADGSVSIAKGGIANNTVVSSGGMVSIVSGGSASNITAEDGARLNMVVASNTYIQGSYNGSAFEMKDAMLTDFAVNSGSVLNIANGGAVSNTIIADGGAMNIARGGVHNGTLTIADGATVTAAAGSTIDFTISGRTEDDDYMINDLSLISGAPNYTVTVQEVQTPGIYKLAQGAKNFTGSISIGNGTITYGVVTANGAALDAGRYNYTLTVDADGNMDLKVGFNTSVGLDFAADGYNNNTMDSALELTGLTGSIEQLTIDSADAEDYYKFTLDATGRAGNAISIDFTAWKGNLDIYLLDGEGNLVKKSESSTDNEVIALNQLAAGDYYLLVKGFEGNTNEYTLSWDLPQAVKELIDEYESGNDKNGCKLGKLDKSMSLNAAIGEPDDEDWFKLQLESGMSSSDTISITYDSADADLEFYIYGSNGKEFLGRGQKTTEGGFTTSTISFANFKKGVYYVQVVSANGGTAAYTLDVNIVEKSSMSAAGNSVYNSSFDNAENLSVLNGTGVIRDLAIKTDVQEDYFKFTLLEDGSSDDYITINYNFVPGGDIDVDIIDVNGMVVAYSHSAESSDKVSLKDLTAGEYYIKVHGYEGSVNSYSIEYNVTNSKLIGSDVYEGVEHSNGFIDIRQDQTISNLTISADNEVFNETKADTFKIVLEYDALKSTRIVLSDYNEELSGLKYVLCDANGNEIASNVGSEISLAGLGKGEYYLSIDTENAEQYTNYSITAQGMPTRALEAGEQDINKWTIFIYIAGDNNLESKYLTELISMQKGKLPDGVEAYVLFDRTEGAHHSADDGNWSGTMVGKVVYNKRASDIRIEWQQLGGQSEWNTGDVNTLEAFLDWGMNEAGGKAENYALIMKDHGTSLGVNSYDDTDVDSMNITDIADLLKGDAYDDFSVVVFDQCLMGSDVVISAMEGAVDYVVASEAIGYTPNQLIMYKNLFSSFTSNMTPLELAQKVVASSNTSGEVPLTLAAFDTGNTYLTDALNEFAGNAENFTYSDWTALCNAFGSAYNYGDEICAYSDLIGILKETLNYEISDVLRNAVNALIEDVSNDVVKATLNTPVTYGNGLAVFNPVKSSPMMTQYSYSCSVGGSLDYFNFMTAIGQESWGKMLNAIGRLSGDVLNNMENSGNQSFEDFDYYYGESHREVVINIGAFSGKGAAFSGLYVSDKGKSRFKLAMLQDGVEGDMIKITGCDPDAVITLQLVHKVITVDGEEETVIASSNTGTLSLEDLALTGYDSSEFEIIVTSSKSTSYTLEFDSQWTTGVDRFDFARTGSIDSSKGGNNIKDKATILAAGTYVGLMTYAGDADYYLLNTVYADELDVTITSGEGLTVKEIDANGNEIEYAVYKDGQYTINVKNGNYLYIEGNASISENEVNGYELKVSDIASAYVSNSGTIEDLRPTIEFSGALELTDLVSSLTVNIAVDDGVEYYYVKDNVFSDSWTAVDGGNIKISENGTYYFEAVDQSGLKSSIISLTVNNIDNVAPTLEIEGYDGNPTQEDVELSAFASDDNGEVTIEYWDGNDWVAGNELIVSEYGTYKFRAKDTAGNITEKTVDVNIDKVAPTLEITGNATEWTNQSVVLTASADEDCTIKYWNGNGWVAGSELTVTENGTYRFLATDLAGNTTEQSVVVNKIDKVAPTLAVAADETALTNDDIDLRATASDNNGEVTIEYWNGNDWVAVNIDGTMRVSESGTYKFRAKDAAGNITEKEITIGNIDKVAPTLEITGNATDWTNKDVVLTATVSDGTVEYYNGSAWIAGNEFTVTENGTYTFRVTDLAGNKTEQSVVVDKIDKDAPTLEITGNATDWTNKDVVLTAAASDGTIEYFDGDNWVVGSIMTVSENGTYKFRAKDAAGNITEKEITIGNIDRDAPDTPVADADIKDATNQDVTVTATFSSDSVVKEYSLNGSDWSEYTSGVVFTENGTVYFRGRDEAGNYSETTGYEVKNIDKVAPAAPGAQADIESVTDQKVTVTATFSEDSVVKEYSLNGSDWFAYTAGVVFEKNGTVYFRSQDKAGNYSAITGYEVKNIDRDAPDTPVADADIKDATNQDVTVTATFSSDSVVKEYSFNNEDWFEYTSGIVFTENGIVYFRGQGVNGRYSYVAEYKVSNIDKIAPEKPVASADITTPTNKIVTVSAVFSTDSVQKQYSFNGSDWFDYTGGVKFANNGMIYFRGIDAAGNISETEFVEVGNIDKSAPAMPTVVIDPNGPAQKAMVTINYSSDSVVKQYKIGGVWYDYTAPIEVERNVVIYFRAEDAAGNKTTGNVSVSNIDRIAPDKPLLTTVNNGSLLQQQITIFANSSDAVEYSIDGKNWLTYTADGVTVLANGEYYFRAIDLAGNISEVASLVVDTIDTVADPGDAEYIFISSKYNEKTTGKKYNGITLTYGENAFSSLEAAGDTTGKTVIHIAGSITGDYLDKGTVAGTTVAPTIKETDNSYSYKAVAAPKGTLSISEDTGSTEFIRFANVNIKGAAVGSVTGGNDSSSEDTKSVKGKNGAVTDTAKYTKNSSAAGKFTAVDGSVESITGYSNVTLTDANVNSIVNNTSKDSRSDSATYAEGSVKRKVTVTSSESTAGTLKATGSTLEDVTGFATVTLKDVTGEADFKRGIYSTIKETLDIKTDKKGLVTGTYSKTETFTRAGKFTATGSVVGDIENFSTVTLDGTQAKAISNTLEAKTVIKDTATWESAEAYGTPEDYDLNLEHFDLENNTTTTRTLNGAVTLKNGAYAESITNFKSVTMTGSEVGLIENVSKVTVNKGDSAIGSYIGTKDNDSLTIAKGAVLTANKIDLGAGAKDTLAINGTLILTGTDVNAAKITGKGEIAVIDDIYDDLALDFANILNVGETADNFRGTAYESADNSIKKAVKWDGAEVYEGWMGSWEGYKDGSDTVDYVKFKAAAGSVISVEGVEDWTLLDKKGNTIEGNEIAAAGEYIIQLKHEEENSINYSITLS